MPKVSEVNNPYFPHDFYPQSDKKIVLLLDEMGYEGYGLYWKLVEFMHANELYVGEENLVCGKDFGEKIKRILNNYDLFRIEDGCYISDRILRNINLQEEKSKKAKDAVNVRWLLADLNSVYKEIFGERPKLSKQEVEKLKQYDGTIDDLRKKFPDILYSLKKLKFKNNPDFNPGINWLLEENNLLKLLNGAYGPLKSWSEHKEFLKKKETQKAEQTEVDSTEIDINTIDSKAVAIQFIVETCPSFNFLTPNGKMLMKKFDITKNEIQAYRDKNNA